MSKKWYGSLSARIEENKFYGEDKTIKEGTDITMYYWSDQHCYYVTKVVDQKHIFVKEYHVCADKDSGSYSNTWKYFKSLKEEYEYLNNWYEQHPEEKYKDYKPYDLDNLKEDEPEEWIFRYNHWNRVNRNRYDYKTNTFIPLEKPEYNRITEGISFNRRDYYYDYEF